MEEGIERNGIFLKADHQVLLLLFFIVGGFGGQVEFRSLKFTGNPNAGKFKPSSGNIRTGTHPLTKWANVHFWSFLESCPSSAPGGCVTGKMTRPRFLHSSKKDFNQETKCRKASKNLLTASKIYLGE